MRNLLFSSFFLFMLLYGQAQSDFVPIGGTAMGGTGSVTYTVGQIAIQNADNGVQSVQEGLQQPYEIQIVGVDEYSGVVLQAVLYPNPTQNMLNLRISNYQIPAGGLTAQLYDANGKLLQTVMVGDPETRFDLNGYAQGTYQLRLLESKHILKTFKVVKNY